MDDECVICLSPRVEFKTASAVLRCCPRTLYCSGCLDSWLERHRTCPTCRSMTPAPRRKPRPRPARPWFACFVDCVGFGDLGDLGDI